eukprot:SAG22_NODE_467_length_10171_cov_4.306295_2_plen_54_part_00
MLKLIGATSALAVGLAFGMPLYLLPAPVCAAVGFAQFHATQKFGPYAVFAAGA